MYKTFIEYRDGTKKYFCERGEKRSETYERAKENL